MKIRGGVVTFLCMLSDEAVYTRFKKNISLGFRVTEPTHTDIYKEA